MTGDLRASARSYAARGWAVFPLRPGSKVPMIAHGSLEASSSLDDVRAWWSDCPEANIAIATGSRSRLLVVDLDGPTAIAQWAAYLSKYGAVRTAFVRTHVGLHLYFTLSRHLPSLPNTAGKLGHGIDTRGEGGYVVAPPSRHPDGGFYEWGSDEREPVMLPRWLEAKLRRREHYGPIGVPQLEGETRYGEAAIRRILEDLSAAGEGTRNDRLNLAAYQCGRLIAAGHLRLAPTTSDLASIGGKLGLAPGEIDATIRSGIHAGMDNPVTVRPR